MTRPIGRQDRRPLGAHSPAHDRGRRRADDGAASKIYDNQVTEISEAPLQMKSNCGTLVIDDFGRQRDEPGRALNRWIVPLEKRHDFLDLASGQKIQVPFDQLIIFSTNLKPSDLVDEAFLRRIPYKIDVNDPSEEQFREVFLRSAESLASIAANRQSTTCSRGTTDRSVEALRFCHARDLVQQVTNFCEFRGHALAVTEQNLDAAVKNYFGK